jgi:hypothetical protein
MVVAFVPGLVAGERFLLGAERYVIDCRTVSGYSALRVYRSLRGARSFSLPDLVRADASWTVAIATLAVAPALFLWWRRSPARFLRGAGVACCVAASAAVCTLALTRPYGEIGPLSWIWCTVPLGGALMAAAFLVAPAPQVRDE